MNNIAEELYSELESNVIELLDYCTAEEIHCMIKRLIAKLRTEYTQTNEIISELK